jgi:DNA-binding beta-propeller fold protein YncE
VSQHILAICVLLIATTALSAGEPAFTEKPTAVATADGVRIAFAVSAPTDVAVSIVYAKGETIRHLAAGRLGRNAPPPFQKDALSQTLLWDGKDDAGNAANGASAARVELGLRGVFDRIIGWSGQKIDAPRAMGCGPDGTLYVAHGDIFYGHRRTMLIAAFDRDGTYLRQVYPGPGDLPAAKRAGWPHMTMDDGREVPVIQHVLTRSLYPGAYFGIGEQNNLAVSADGKVVALCGHATTLSATIKYADVRGGRRLLILNADGSVPANFLGPVIAPAKTAGKGYLAVSPDGKYAYVCGMGAVDIWGKKKPAEIHNVVYRAALAGAQKAEVFVGTLRRAGAGKDGLNDPRGVAVGPGGNVYVADFGNQRIVAFSPAGRYVGEIPAEGATDIMVSAKTGAVYARIGYNLVKFGGLGDPVEKTRIALVRLHKNLEKHRFHMALDDSGDRPVLWLSSTWWVEFRLVKVVDEGRTLRTVSRPVAEKLDSASGALPFIMNVVPVGDLLITQTPSLPRASTTSMRFDARTGAYLGTWFPKGPDGQKEKRNAVFFCGGEYTGGKDGRVYSQTGGFMWPAKGSANPGTLRRYDTEGKPVPFPAVGKHFIHEYYHGHHRPAGMFVRPDGTIYLAAFPGYRGRDQKEKGLHVYVLSADGKLQDDRRVFVCGATVGGIAVDPAGNIYLGAQLWPKGQRIPEWFADRLPASSEIGHPRRAYRQHGVLLKFPPSGGTITPDERGPFAGHAGGYAKPAGKSPLTLRVEGAQWIRRVGYVPINDPSEAGCQCENTRFDVDDFGRVFVPDLYRFRIQVFDGAGNEVTAFGGYGNMDNRGPQSKRPSPAIPLGWPIAARVAHGAVYVADLSNRRIVRVRLESTTTAVAKIAAAD